MRSLLLVVAASAFITHAASAAIFIPLGDLPGGGESSLANDVSANGKFAVGASDSLLGNSDEAFRWSEPNGMEALGDLDGGPYASVAFAVSADGSVVVGTGHRGTQEAFTWTAANGIVGLGVLAGLPGTVASGASATSANGAVVVGSSGPTDLSNMSRAFRWTQATGMVDLGLPINGRQASAHDVSADGSRIVGVMDTNDDDAQAFLWTEAAGFIGLGDLPGGDFNSSALAISGDGTVVVGHSNTGVGAGEAFRWTQATGMVSIGDLLGGQVNAAAWGTNHDGSIVVGASSVSTAPPQDAAFIWDAAHGMRNLQTVLETEYGLDLMGWKLGVAKGISADGRVIVGTGTNPAGIPQAWMVRLAIPEPGSIALFSIVGTVAVLTCCKSHRQ